jgi:transposase-like protein
MSFSDRTDPRMSLVVAEDRPGKDLQGVVNRRPEMAQRVRGGEVVNPITSPDVKPLNRRWLTIFEDRHGIGAYERLIAELRQPCVTFADIAKRLDVSRERVRQWQRLLLPDSPRGHERQRLCAIYRRKRRLLEDPLFRTFYRHARAFVRPGRIELIDASAGYRTRAVRIDRQIVALRDARRSASATVSSNRHSYLLARCRAADFLYYQLTSDDYLLLPVHQLPVAGTTFVDRPGSRYEMFKNTFEALGAEASSRQMHPGDNGDG